jgi:peptide/nickel transport system substrate-binding protein
MCRSLWRTALLCLCIAGAAFALAACGSSSSSSSSSSSTSGGNTGANYNLSQGQKKGGTLNVLSFEDFDYIDPGQAYFQVTYEWMSDVYRTLYQYKPNDPLKPAPDLATAAPTISADKKTLTIHLKHGIKFAPPVNRDITSADVKYAMERGFTKQVSNGYAAAYFGSLQGAPAGGGNYQAIPGLQTPDKYTLVMKLTKPLAGTVAQALVLPLTSPVPKSYAFKYDQQNPTTYGSHHGVATGPYMIQADSSGSITGYTPGRHLILVRNPNWDPKTDWRPAYVDKINWTIGNDPTVMGRQILTGSNMISGDTVPAPLVKLAVQKYHNQIALVGGSGNRYVALNTTIPPFNNSNLRKAVYAATNKNAMRLTRGGPVTGDIATHFIGPGVPGYKEGGGAAGPDVDFNKNPNGDMTVAKKYLKLAGFPNGKYNGPQILMVGDNSDPAGKTALVFLQTLQSLGFNVNFKSVEHSVMYTNFCNVPKKKVQVCPNVGWIKDFNDGDAWLDVPFNGKNIVPVNNSNWPQLNEKSINKGLDTAQTIVNPTQRAQAYGKLDDQITQTAAAIPWLWDKLANIRSKNVKGVIAIWNASWDFAFTSVK